MLHKFTISFIHSSIQCYTSLQVCLFVRSFVCSFIHSHSSLTHSSLTHSLSHSFTQSFTHSFITHSFITHSFITHSFITQSFIHSVIHSLTHSLSHSFTVTRSYSSNRRPSSHSGVQCPSTMFSCNTGNFTTLQQRLYIYQLSFTCIMCYRSIMT